LLHPFLDFFFFFSRPLCSSSLLAHFSRLCNFSCSWCSFWRCLFRIDCFLSGIKSNVLLSAFLSCRTSMMMFVSFWLDCRPTASIPKF
jgi:hypothetical protein